MWKFYLILAFVFASCGSLKITKILLKKIIFAALTFNTINNINDLYDMALFTREHILKRVVEHSLISGVKENEIQNLF